MPRRQCETRILIRLMLSVTILMAIIGAFIVAANVTSDHKLTISHSLHLSAEKTKHLVERLKYLQNEFVLNDLSNEDFYRGEQTVNLRKHAQLMRSLYKEFVNMRNILGVDDDYSAVKKFEKAIYVYDHAFMTLITAYRMLGYEEYGIVGGWNEAIEVLERKVAEKDSAKLERRLIQLERLSAASFLGKKGKENQIFELLGSFRHSLKEFNEKDVGVIVEAVSAGESAFLDYMRTKKIIGETDKEGLRKNIRNAIKQIEEDSQAVTVYAINRSHIIEENVTKFRLWIFLGGLFFGWIVFYLISKSLVTPIVLLRDAMLKVRDGTLDYCLDVESMDEIGQLADCFNEMVCSIKKLIEKEKNLSREVAKNEAVSVWAMELKKSYALIREIINKAPVGIFVIEEEGAIEYVNEALSKTLGPAYDQKMIIGYNFYDFNIYNELGLAKKVKELQEGKISSIGPLEYRFYQEGKVVVHNYIGIVYGQETRKVLLFVQDLTDLKKAEEDIKKAMEIKSEFTSIVSHELRTPLTAIKESIAILQEGLVGELTDGQKDFLDTARRNVDRLSRLINNVLDYQKLDAGQMVYDFQDNDINELVGLLNKTMLPVLKQKKIDFEAHLEKDLPLFSFDYDRICQVFTNLLNNAIKFTDTGKIIVSTRLKDDSIIVSIADTGIGIRDEDRERLFKTFSQIASSSERKMGSTGLGLSISKKIVEHHNGEIWFESEFGKGTVFSFSLPTQERKNTDE